MAVFGNVILLSIGFLLTEFLVECFGREISTQRLGKGNDCTPGNVCSCKYGSCSYIQCKDIDTEEEVGCARHNLRELQANVSFTHLAFIGSELKFIPDDFLESHPLKFLAFIDCTITQIPRGLIAPVCSTLNELDFIFNHGLKTIGEMAFGECTGLRHLHLMYNEIEQVSPVAFYGLSNLEKLDLGASKMAAFEGLEGIPQLRYLSLFSNDIRFMAKNAFQNLSNLKIIDLEKNALITLENGTFDPLTSTGVSVNLNGNPLKCDCSLKWLQDWSRAKSADLKAACGQERVNLNNTDMSHCPATVSRDRATGSTIDVIVTLLINALTYFRVI